MMMLPRCKFPHVQQFPLPTSTPLCRNPLPMSTRPNGLRTMTLEEVATIASLSVTSVSTIASLTDQTTLTAQTTLIAQPALATAPGLWKEDHPHKSETSIVNCSPHGYSSPFTAKPRYLGKLLAIKLEVSSRHPCHWIPKTQANPANPYTGTVYTDSSDVSQPSQHSLTPSEGEVEEDRRLAIEVNFRINQLLAQYGTRIPQPGEKSTPFEPHNDSSTDEEGLPSNQRKESHTSPSSELWLPKGLL